MQPVYKPGTTSDQIILDGWARGFDVTQTEEELQAQGYMVSRVAILAEWVRLDEELHDTHIRR